MERNPSPEIEYLRTVYNLDSNEEACLRQNGKRARPTEISVAEKSHVDCYMDGDSIKLSFTPIYNLENQTARRRKIPAASRTPQPQYRLSPDPSKTVCGSFHQNSDGFGLSEYRGSQCTSVAFSAILTAKSIPVHTWTSADMDNITRFGDDNHRRLLADLGRDFKSNDLRIGIDELKHGDKHWYSTPIPEQNIDWTQDYSKKLALSIHKSDEYFGSVSPKGSWSGDVALEAAIDKVFRQGCEAALITIGDKTGALIKDNLGKLRFFDSHSNNKIGRTNANGTSVLLTFNTVREFARHIRRQRSSTYDRFEMYGLNVRCERRTAIVKPMPRRCQQ